MELTPRQRVALESICETFCPPVNGVPGARELGVPDALLAAVALNPRRAEVSQLQLVLSLWDTAAMTALGGGGFARFSELSQEERERVLLSWCDSRLPQRRALFQALRKGALLCYYMLPGRDGGANPAWDAIGYDGPLGRRPDAPPKKIRPLGIERDTRLDCDVVIVGSGAGGGAAAGVLSASGLDVVVLEGGDYYDDEDFDGSELTALTGFYQAAPGATADQSVGLIAGSCLGGGTVVNYTTSFRTPDEVREEWASLGTPQFLGSDYDAAMDAVCERLGVTQEYSQPSSRDDILQRGCAALGWHVDSMPRNVRNCAQGRECGYCNLGCRVGAKQSTVKTWLSDAFDRGARIVVRTRVKRVLVEQGAARGVEATTVEGHRVTVRARAVVAACGALHTPALLRRSGLQNANIGKHLKLHPATVVWALFDEQTKPWEGVMQARYSDQHRWLDGPYGVKYETAATHPHIAIPFVPWRSSRQHYELMQGLPHVSPLGVLLRDRDGGEVRVGRDGEPVPRYAFSDFDLGHVRTGLDGAAQILEAAGARRIFSSHAKWVAYDPGVRGSREEWLRAADACGYRNGQCQFASFHIMGSARMAGSPAVGACDPSGQTWDVRDLYVCDASAFPTSSGINPQISIQSIAHMTAQGIAARLG